MSVGAVAANEQVEGLPFHLFLWVTAPTSSISPRDIQVFLRMLDNGSWCQSRWARENLHRTQERYSSAWTVEALSRSKRDLERLHAGLRSLRELIPHAEVEATRTDLQRLAEATARASGGLLGPSSLRRERREALLVFSALANAVLATPEESPRPVAATNGGMGAPSTPGAPGPRPASAVRPRRRVRCVQVMDETADVRTFRFAPLAPGSFEYLPGQFMTVEVEANGEVMKRSYTIASSPTRPGLLEITVKRVPGGRVSNWLHDNLRVGDEVTVGPPAGKFSCEIGPKAEKLLFISGGSGITPVMSMTRFMHDNADPRDVVFLYSARNESDLIFKDELSFIAARSTNFRTVFTLTNAPPDWRGFRGRISTALIEDAVPDFRQRSVYLCGPTPFMETVRQALAATDFPMASFHAESFGGPRASAAVSAAAPSATGEAPAAVAAPSSPAISMESLPPGLAATTSPPPPAERPRRSSQLLGILPRPRLTLISDPAGARPMPSPANTLGTPAGGAPAGGGGATAVVFNTSGREARACAGETILEAAEALGLSLPSACRSGVCGTCKTRKISGSVKMSCEDGLDPGDRSAGYILACTAEPVDRVVLEA
ncbi:MAG TPA: hybrid-cluster NAD(P)-dependent oxidoreductase [Polyangia bacterium]